MIWLLANWRLAGFAALVIALAAVSTLAGLQTMRLQNLQAEWDYFQLEIQADAREAKARAEAADAHHQLINEELQHDIASQREKRAHERAARSDRFAALYGKYFGLLNAGPGSGPVPEAVGGAAELVHAGDCRAAERRRIAAELRQPLRVLFEGTRADLEGPVTDALADRQFWGRWARLVNVCPKESH